MRHVNHPQIHTFTPHIWVSSLRAKLAGDVYGLVKTYLPPSQFHYLGSDFGHAATSLNCSEVKLPGGELLIATGLVPPLAERMKETAQFKENYEFVVGNTKNIIVSTIFGFQCIVMDQGFDSSKARKSVLPSTGAVKIPKSAKVMMPVNKLTNMLSLDAFGAFIIQTSWTMKAPKACW